MEVFPMNTAVVFSVGLPHAVEDLGRTGIYMDHLDSAYFSMPYPAGARYRVYSEPDGDGLWPLIEDPALFRKYLLQTPASNDTRTRDLALRIGANASDGFDKVEAVTRYLRRRYAYSTFSRDGRANLEDFLFRTRAGNCEYFATAGAILLRHLGVPTRLVTGFSATEWNEYGRFYDVRQGHAHAWAEALVAGRWLTVDPTPGSESVIRSLGDHLSKYFDAVQVRWYSNVIGYDRFTQRNSFYRFGQSVASLPDVDWRALRPSPAQGAAALLALALLALLRLRRRVPAGVFPRAESIVARADLRRPAHQTPLEFARSAREGRPELSPLLTLAELHYRDRFGPGLSPADRARVEELLEALRKAVLVQ
ncbi:MAG: DUF4129 domain-containing protein [Elusimicrobia bacterium]|nr:DUF4129 domain-containing protein [Elusimicrobiota bacterium]